MRVNIWILVFCFLRDDAYICEVFDMRGCNMYAGICVGMCFYKEGETVHVLT